MPQPLTINVPHALGREEARRRLEQGFGQIRQQMTGGAPGWLAFQERWDGDRLSFEGGALGQKIAGRVDVLPDSVRIEIDLPMILAAIAERITKSLQVGTTKLLERK